jgi:dihydrofolate reductase
MAKLVYGLNQSLDGYVDHMKIGPPDPALSRHFIEQARGLTGAVYGRRMYEIMRYWDDDLPDWDAEDRDFEAVIRRLKAQLEGEIDVAGPNLAGSLTNLGLIDEYRLYIHPIVLGSGQPFFAGPRPRLRLVASDRIGGDVIRLTYVPA